MEMIIKSIEMNGREREKEKRALNRVLGDTLEGERFLWLNSGKFPVNKYWTLFHKILTLCRTFSNKVYKTHNWYFLSHTYM